LLCRSCYLTISLMKWLYPVLQAVRHLMECLREARGEEVPMGTARKRSLRMLANISVKATPKVASRKTFRPQVG